VSERRLIVARAVRELSRLLDENEAERETDWHGYVGEALGALEAALESMRPDGSPAENWPHGSGGEA
jgi:hypothetical protein